MKKLNIWFNHNKINFDKPISIICSDGLNRVIDSIRIGATTKSAKMAEIFAYNSDVRITVINKRTKFVDINTREKGDITILINGTQIKIGKWYEV